MRRPTEKLSTLRLASVSFINAKPLIYGLEAEPAAPLTLAVPSQLAGLLATAQADVALLPVIDYQRLNGLTIIPAGGIGCFGPTLTVRIFSRRPIETIDTLACDPDSHTSVALATVILAERFGRRIRRIDLRDLATPSDCPRLLIGDKVITEEPAGFPHQLDLGQAWRDLTGLPFVFATWMARPGAPIAGWLNRLRRAKEEGLANVESILDAYAEPHGWPRDIARRYLTQYLRYDIGQEQLNAIRRFHQLAHQHGLGGEVLQDLRLA